MDLRTYYIASKQKREPSDKRNQNVVGYSRTPDMLTTSLLYAMLSEDCSAPQILKFFSLVHLRHASIGNFLAADHLPCYIWSSTVPTTILVTTTST